jgi:ABC-type bacteriocin/lantibiotic exporter with double-glycine peptidase domain
VVFAVLNYWQAWYGHETDLYGLLETTQKDGTHPAKMAEGVRVFGLSSQLKVGMTLGELKDALKDGATVILDLQAWPDKTTRGTPWRDLWDSGHYVVLVGMDEKFAYVMDPSVHTGYAWVPLPELEERWHDYEDRTGEIQRHERLGIVIKGDKPLVKFPSPLIRME